jgi:hypothetical protein
MSELRKSQLDALEFVKEKASSTRSAARRKAEEMLNSEGIPFQVFDDALVAIKTNAPIDVSFHPDRLDLKGETVVEALIRSARYRNQFETGISNGGVTAFEGGERDQWEEHLFGGAYQQPGVTPADRPKYGALNLLNHWDGACPRFGCCYFRLKPRVAERCTFAYGDSSTEPDDMGTINVFDSVLAAALEAIQTSGRALGGRNLNVKTFLGRILQQTDFHSAVDFEGPPGRSLDESTEVHIHGPVDLNTDVECLVADGAFRNTFTGKQLNGLSQRYEFALYWNPGLFLPTSEVRPDCRGPIMVTLAKHIAKDGVLDAAKIGQAAVSLRTNSEAWRDWGTFDETLQYLKQMWHVLATFGRVGAFK